MVKNYKVYEFSVKRLKDYHDYHIEKYIKNQPEGECFIPLLAKIDFITDVIKERGYLWRNPQEMEAKMDSLVPEFVSRYTGNDYFDI